MKDAKWADHGVDHHVRVIKGDLVADGAAWHVGELPVAEWAQRLAEEIQRAQAVGDPDLGDTYYQHWLSALERLGSREGLDRCRRARTAQRRMGGSRAHHAAWAADRAQVCWSE